MEWEIFNPRDEGYTQRKLDEVPSRSPDPVCAEGADRLKYGEHYRWLRVARVQKEARSFLFRVISLYNVSPTGGKHLGYIKLETTQARGKQSVLGVAQKPERLSLQPLSHPTEETTDWTDHYTALSRSSFQGIGFVPFPQQRHTAAVRYFSSSSIARLALFTREACRKLIGIQVMTEYRLTKLDLPETGFGLGPLTGLTWTS
ncbi:hypothetical protein WN48_01993 [Eufriesea mexicana]|nr:hypothetical protein WN48_01993 [Eufriesea mexicana]